MLYTCCVFQNRRETLDKIETKLKASSVLALTGLHGTGKSQLALAHALKHQEEYGFVRWLDADGDSLDASLREFGVGLCEWFGLCSC